ncbi:hypothetical protein [Sporosarcina ureilytica]|uniref:Lipoprotein n=1 Tax=Sporosarcina ureilytica TaxID=298596 RepID=A0A1D8JG78_9BACL|nr:hypothetical protein [Sporosarcina ureilytica]AOV07706.1 hypothetical protein BI350_09285 [Sporosarcina ureilytica]
MKKANYLIIVLTLALLVTGCADKAVKDKDVSIKDGTNITSKETAQKNQGGEQGTNEGLPHQNDETTVPLRDFFLKDGTKAHYKGEGNEFAGFTIEVAQPYENYFIIYEDNGGVFLRKIFKVTDNQIYTLEESTVNYKDEFPSIEELDALTPVGIYLQKPFEKGATFDLWTIIKTDETVETPFRTFENAIVIEKKDKNSINRKYFVQGFGEVKREAIQTSEGNSFTVTSELESVDGH